MQTVIFNLLIVSGLYGIVVSKNGGNIVNKYFLDKQKFLFEILHRVEDPLVSTEWRTTGQSLVLEKSEYVDYNDEMIQFYVTYRDGYLLPRNLYYSPLIADHYKQSLGLFYFFYNAKDWEILQTNICWARRYANPGMFVNALTQALMKREDFKGLILPKIYEILPQHFFHEKYVRQAEKFDYSAWVRDKTHDRGEPKRSKKSNKNLSADKRTWQWWKVLGLNEEVYQSVVKYLLPHKIANLRENMFWSQAMEDVGLLWLPVDYSRDISSKSHTRKLTYLTEDVDWNAYWYYLNMGLSLTQVQTDIDKDKIREWWFWNLQQLLVRYKMEMQSLGVKEQAIQNYEPALVTWTGEKFRPHSIAEDQIISNYLTDLSDRVQKVISEESHQLRNGSRIYLKNKNNLKIILADIFDMDGSKIYAHIALESHIKPKLLLNLETMMREPKFYIYAENLVNSYHLLKSLLPAYNSLDFVAPGVKIDSVEVSSLITYYDLVDTDTSNLLNDKHYYFDGQFLWSKSLHARQQRLNHKPFSLQFNITSDQPQAIILRTFLSSSLDFMENPYNFYQLDTFVANLVAGHNIVERQSAELFGTIPDHIGYSELYGYTLLAMNDKFDFPLNVSTANCGFPNRLILPRGVSEPVGLPMKMFFMAMPYSYRFQEGYNLDCDFACGIMSFDEMPYGFPFDRDTKPSIFTMDNVFWKNVKIFHDKRFNKKL